MLLRIGDIEVWRILESVEPFMTPGECFPNMGEDGLAAFETAAPRQIAPETGQFIIAVQGFLIRTPQHLILVDSCVGNDKTNLYHAPWHQRSGTRFMASLAAAGVTPDDIDYVMCTHLHTDHVGWNTRLENGRWVPTFPNARYLFPSADAAHFGATPSPTYNESVLPVIEHGLAELVEAGHGIGEFISLLPTPGHSPGHVSVELAGPGRRALITGDALHSPAQCLHPDWHFRFDLDPELAVKSRTSLLERAVEGGHRMIGTHFPLPSIGTVGPAASGFTWTED